MNLLDICGFMAVFLLLVTVGWRGSKAVKSEENYLLANRGIGLFPLTATLVMTEFNPSTLIAFSSAGYLVGSWALSLPAAFFVGLMFYSLTVAKKMEGAQLPLCCPSFFKEIWHISWASCQFVAPDCDGRL